MLWVSSQIAYIFYENYIDLILRQSAHRNIRTPCYQQQLCFTCFTNIHTLFCETRH
nr:hypothetical protein [uncultured bacterium]